MPLHQKRCTKRAGVAGITLLASAKNTISLWQTELQLGIIGDENKASLIAGMKYIQALPNVDATLAPDIDWPVPPE